MGDWATRIESRLAELADQGKDRPGLARACGVKPSSVSGWFGIGTKRTEMIRGDNLIAAAKYLNTTAEWIMTGRDAGRLDSQLQRLEPDMLQDAMGFLDELDGILGRKPSPRPDPARLAIALQVVAEGEIVDGKSRVVRLADRLREAESRRGNESGQAAGTGAADGSAHGRGTARKAGSAGGRRK